MGKDGCVVGASWARPADQTDTDLRAECLSLLPYAYILTFVELRNVNCGGRVIRRDSRRLVANGVIAYEYRIDWSLGGGYRA